MVNLEGIICRKLLYLYEIHNILYLGIANMDNKEI